MCFSNWFSSKKIKKLRVVFIFKNFGLIKGVSHIGLGVASANTSSTLKQNGIDAEVWSILNYEEMVDKLAEDHKHRHHKHHHHKPITHVVISAPWVPTALLADLVTQYKDIKFTVVSHSNVGFLAADRNGIKLLREEMVLQSLVDNFQVAGNSKKFADWATVAWGDRVAFLPNLYNVSKMEYCYKHWDKKETLRIGCFGAMRPLKNQITAAAAALAIAKELDVPVELWFNSGRNEGNIWALNAIEQLVGNVKNFQIKFKPWSPWEEFRQFVGTMHLNLQPSYTESFNMVVADSVYESIPAVVSDAITWAPEDWVANTDEALEIAKVGIELLKDGDAAMDGQDALRRYVRQGVKAWKKYLLK